MFHRVLWLAAFLIMGGTHPADAAVIERDWKTAGDGLLTYDDLNGREWLDLTETLGISLEDVLTQLDAEFSVATVADVYRMATSAGIVPGPEYTEENVEPVSRLQTLIGVTNNGGFGVIRSIGMAESDDSMSLSWVSFGISKWPPEDTAGLFTAGDAYTDTRSDAGIWFFRPVPEPSSLLLYGLAIAYFCFLCRQARP